MRSWWCLAATLAPSVGAISQALFQPPDSGVLEDIRAQFNLPGLGAFRSRPDETQMDVVGVRKMGDPTKIELSDKFHLGSFSKSMTATLIGMLVDEGVVDWDMPLSEALPDFTLAEGHRNTTIAMLATHNSGIGASLGEGFLKRLYGLTAVEGRNLIIRRFLVNNGPKATVGKYFYDNTNYIVLGRVLENFAGTEGETYEDMLTSRLFRPLSMDCGFGTPPESSNTSIENPWGHHVTRGDGPRVPTGGPLLKRDYPPAFDSTGTVHCDMESYEKFARLHIDGFNGLPTSLNISTETFQKLHTPHPNSENYTYGAWVYGDGSQTPWSNGPTLEYSGSNLVNFASVLIAPKLLSSDGTSLGEALGVFTNVGNALSSGESVPATGATNNALLSMMNGTLFP